MSIKRRDNKNRVLRNGESQRSDGRYRFKYFDVKGKPRDIYSWRLEHNDPTPSGKRRDLSLREKEKLIETDKFNGVVTGGGYTVLSLCEKYTSIKTGVRNSTRAGYGTVLNILKKDSFGRKHIEDVHLSDAQAWLVKLQKVDERSYSSIHTIRGVLRPAFRMAVDDDLIRKNPFDFELVTVIVNDSVTREAISRKQMRDYLKFVADDIHFKRYYDGIYAKSNTSCLQAYFLFQHG